QQHPDQCQLRRPHDLDRRHGRHRDGDWRDGDGAGLPGGNTITTGAGNDTIRFGGPNNVVNAGGGNNVLVDSGSNNTIVLPGANQGYDDISGALMTNGDQFDLRALLA